MTPAERIKSARQAGVPIILITTSDAPAMIASIQAAYSNGSTVPLVAWDCAAGLSALNETGAQMLRRIAPPPDPNSFAPAAGNALTDALSLADKKFEPKSILIVSMSHRTVNDSMEAIQAVTNLRDVFKGSVRKTLVLLAPTDTLPVELQNDVMVIDDPLPTEPEIESLITREVEAAQLARECETPTAPTLAGGVSALSGLPRFAVEQAVALTIIERNKIDVDELWERKRSMISQIKGLSLERSVRTLDGLAGLQQIISFARRTAEGEEPPALYVRIDEIEKAMAGAAGDLSGVSTDQLGVVLSSMEDFGWNGSILVGVPGSGKSEFSKRIGPTFSRRTLLLDLGAAKGSLVGQSEQQIRNMMKTIRAIAGSRAHFLASCNKLETLPAELRRRFRSGIWFFDLPTPEEREGIWTIHLKGNGLDLDAPRPNDNGWTGAEVRNVCEMARRLRMSLSDASQYIVPVSQSDPESVERLRRAAAGKFLASSYPGFYRLPSLQDAAPVVAARRYAEES